MSASNAAFIEQILNTVPPLPMSPEHWQAVVRHPQAAGVIGGYRRPS